MANSVGTKEQREELRQWWIAHDKEHGLHSDNDFLRALDGLDIAQEMAEGLRFASEYAHERDLHGLAFKECGFEVCMKSRAVLAEWDKWKGTNADPGS